MILSRGAGSAAQRQGWQPDVLSSDGGLGPHRLGRPAGSGRFLQPLQRDRHRAEQALIAQPALDAAAKLFPAPAPGDIRIDAHEDRRLSRLPFQAIAPADMRRCVPSASSKRNSTSSSPGILDGVGNLLPDAGQIVGMNPAKQLFAGDRPLPGKVERLSRTVVHGDLVRLEVPLPHAQLSALEPETHAGLALLERPAQHVVLRIAEPVRQQRDCRIGSFPAHRC